MIPPELQDLDRSLRVLQTGYVPMPKADEALTIGPL